MTHLFYLLLVLYEKEIRYWKKNVNNEIILINIKTRIRTVEKNRAGVDLMIMNGPGDFYFLPVIRFRKCSNSAGRSFPI